MNRVFPNLTATETQDLIRLVPLLRDDSLPAEQVARIEELVCHRADGPWTYLKAINVVTGLHWCLTSEKLTASATPELKPRSSASALSNPATVVTASGQISTKRTKKVRAIKRPGDGRNLTSIWHKLAALFGRSAIGWTLAIATLIYGSFTVMVWNMRGERSRLLTHDGAQSVVGTLVASEQCVWQPSTTTHPPEIGAELPTSQPKTLVSGVAEIQFADGAKVLVQGPSTFELRSASSMHLKSGKLTAHVGPQAVGFFVETPKAKIVDLGTEFGVTVAENGATEVHVITGLVETSFQPSDSQAVVTVRTRRGQAVRIAPEGSRGDNVLKSVRAKANRKLFADNFSRPVQPTRSRPLRVTFEAGDDTAKFRFPTVPSPSNRDVADASHGSARISALGELGASLPVTALLDGRGLSEGHVRFSPGHDGKILLDLGRRMSIAAVHTYSWHIDGPPLGATQAYELFGSDADQPPSVQGNLIRSGWTYLASVNTESALGRAPQCASQQVVRIAGDQEPIGEFRHLLWLVLPLRQDTTYYEEFDVIEAAK